MIIYIFNYYTLLILKSILLYNQCLNNYFFYMSFISNFFVFIRSLDPAILRKEKEEYRKLTLQGKAVKVFIQSMSAIVQNFMICAALKFAARTIALPKGPLPTSCMGEIDAISKFITTPLIEEIIFRGVVQNMAMAVQKHAEKKAWQSVKKQRIFKILTSPSALVIGTNAIFAAMHFTNSGKYLSKRGAIIQCLNIAFLPTCSLLHYTTGNILAPIFAHAMNNIVVSVIRTKGWLIDD